MGTVIILAIITVVLLAINLKTDWDFFFPVITFVIAAVCLFVALIAIPIQRQDDVDFALRVTSYRKTLVVQRQMSELERVSLTKEVMDINASLKQRQYWLHNDWYSVYHNACVDTLKPLE